MKAITYKKFGSPDVLHLSEVETPVPQDTEVLIKVHAAGVTLFDCWMRSGYAPPGFKTLMRLSTGFAPSSLSWVPKYLAKSRRWAKLSRAYMWVIPYMLLPAIWEGMLNTSVSPKNL